MYKVEVKVVNDNKWYSNGKQYETEKKADLAAVDLASRWMAVVEHRVVKV